MAVMVYHGDNLKALRSMRARLRGQVTLAYLDPPAAIAHTTKRINAKTVI